MDSHPSQLVFKFRDVVCPAQLCSWHHRGGAARCHGREERIGDRLPFGKTKYETCQKGFLRPRPRSQPSPVDASESGRFGLILGLVRGLLVVQWA